MRRRSSDLGDSELPPPPFCSEPSGVSMVVDGRDNGVVGGEGVGAVPSARVYLSVGDVGVVDGGVDDTANDGGVNGGCGWRRTPGVKEILNGIMYNRPAFSGPRRER